MIWLPIGGNYVEIDGYASALAYAELLNQRGKLAKVYLSHQPNHSVPPRLRINELENFNFPLAPNDTAIVLDISIPGVIREFVPEKQIAEIIDHHRGYEKYWQERLGKKALIEKIGAVATIIFERWGNTSDYSKMSPEIAKLLLAAILDNTLNFNAFITSTRDHEAAQKLATIAKTNVASFAQRYFESVSASILADLPKSISNDVKPFQIPDTDTKILCGQIALWNAKEVLDQRQQIHDIMNQLSEKWMISILSISGKRNYFLTNGSKFEQQLAKHLKLTKEGDWLVSNHLYLRKEIFNKFLEEKNT